MSTIIDSSPVTYRTHAPEINSDAGAARNRINLQFDQFIQVLVSELKNQDPTNPVDNSQFLSQLASLQNLETMASMQESLDSFMKFQQISAAAAMIGREAMFIDPATGQQVRGEVEKIVFDSGKVDLVVNGVRVAFENVKEVL